MSGRTAACLLAFALAAADAAWAQRSPLRRYDVADGLAQGNVWFVHQDGRGYLWIGTEEGLSRFDGYEFLTYSMRDGLPHPAVTSMAEDSEGRLWVGTFAGVARLEDGPGGLA